MTRKQFTQADIESLQVMLAALFKGQFAYLLDKAYIEDTDADSDTINLDPYTILANEDGTFSASATYCSSPQTRWQPAEYDSETVCEHASTLDGALAAIICCEVEQAMRNWREARYWDGQPEGG